MTDPTPMPGTALPWRTETPADLASPHLSHREVLAEADGEAVVVCEVFYSDTDDTEAERNAAYIVWACNNAPALLSALEKAREALFSLGVTHNRFVGRIGPEPDIDRLYPWIGRLGRGGVQEALSAENAAAETLAEIATAITTAGGRNG